MKSIQRNTLVISVSVSEKVARKLDQLREARGQSRSAVVASLINKYADEEAWSEIYAKGKQTAKAFNITSEDDIDRILHEQ